MRYVVFDVETPNHLNHRMSAIGVEVLDDDRIIREHAFLVNPETDFDYFNTWLTGISEEDVADAPTFPELWKTLEPLFAGGVLVAHNAPFDLGVLSRCLRHYEIGFPEEIPYLCTVRIGRAVLPGRSHRLDALCGDFGIPLNHHRAESDARACAELLIRYMHMGVRLEDYIRYRRFDF